jgi:hypothetical protein
MRRAKCCSTSGRRSSAAARAVMSPHITYLPGHQGRRRPALYWQRPEQSHRAGGTQHGPCTAQHPAFVDVRAFVASSVNGATHRSGSLNGLCMPDLGVAFMEATNGSTSYSCVSGTCAHGGGQQALQS